MTNLKRVDPWLQRVSSHTVCRHWLLTRGSLTAKLRATYAPLQVHCLHAGWTRIPINESAVMGLPARQRIWLREVCLQGAGQPRVFAHSIISATALRGRWLQLRHLGQRPLGEVLFHSPTLQRSQLTFKKLPRQHPLFVRIVRAGLANPHAVLWARRSFFNLPQGGMLVTEVFLPATSSNAVFSDRSAA